MQVVARGRPVLGCLENAARLPEARAISLVLLFLGDEVLPLHLHLARRALGVSHALVELGRDQVLVPPQGPWRICTALILMAVNLFVPFDPLLVQVLPLLHVLEDVLVVVLLRGLLVLRMHWVQSRHDAREGSLAADPTRLRPLSPDEEVVADQIVLVVDDDRLVFVPVLQAHDRAALGLCLQVLPATFAFWHVLVLLDGALRADSLGRVRLLEDTLVLLSLFGRVAARTLALLAGDYLWLSLWPNLHDAALGPASDGHALAVVRPVFLREYVLEDRELVVIDIEEVVLLIVVVVEVNDSEVVCGALVVPLLPRVAVVGVSGRVVVHLEVVVVILMAAPTLVEVPLEDEVVALIVLLRVGARPPLAAVVQRIAARLSVEALYDLVLEAVEDRGLLMASEKPETAVRLVDVRGILLGERERLLPAQPVPPAPIAVVEELARRPLSLLPAPVNPEVLQRLEVVRAHSEPCADIMPLAGSQATPTGSWVVGKACERLGVRPRALVSVIVVLVVLLVGRRVLAVLVPLPLAELVAVHAGGTGAALADPVGGLVGWIVVVEGLGLRVKALPKLALGPQVHLPLLLVLVLEEPQHLEELRVVVAISEKIALDVPQEVPLRHLRGVAVEGSILREVARLWQTVLQLETIVRGVREAREGPPPVVVGLGWHAIRRGEDVGRAQVGRRALRHELWVEVHLAPLVWILRGVKGQGLEMRDKGRPCRLKSTRLDLVLERQRILRGGAEV